MALTALTVADTISYVSDLDPAKSKRFEPIDAQDLSKGEIEVEAVAGGATVFHLRSLDVFLMGHIYDKASTLSGKQGDTSIGIHTHINQTNIDAVKHGLVGVENFLDGKGRMIPFNSEKTYVNGREYTVADDAVLNALGIRLIAELATKIKEISEVSAVQEKN